MNEKQHPEQRAGEIYMGNVPEIDFEKSSWWSKRMGSAALYSDGTPLSEADNFWKYRPWFIEASEVRNVIEREEYDRGPGYKNAIRTYREMLKRAYEETGR